MFFGSIRVYDFFALSAAVAWNKKVNERQEDGLELGYQITK